MSGDHPGEARVHGALQLGQGSNRPQVRVFLALKKTQHNSRSFGWLARRYSTVKFPSQNNFFRFHSLGVGYSSLVWVWQNTGIPPPTLPTSSTSQHPLYGVYVWYEKNVVSQKQVPKTARYLCVHFLGGRGVVVTFYIFSKMYVKLKGQLWKFPNLISNCVGCGSVFVRPPFETIACLVGRARPVQ